MKCIDCDSFKGTCLINDPYGIGAIKRCPYINEPVIGNTGYIMNPPWTEKILLSDGHIFLIPEKGKHGWNIQWIITKNGAGSCGRSNRNNYVLSRKSAISEMMNHWKITDKNKEEILNPKTEYIKYNALDKKLPSTKKMVIEEIVVPKSGDQLDLFA